jgi:signal transduction histidine kinase
MNYIIRAQRQLDALAGHIEQTKDTILDECRRLVDGDPMLSNCSRVAREQFIDHIPVMLEALCSKLRSWPDDNRPQQKAAEHEAAESHSQQRWLQGYDIRALVREWGHFNMCLVQEFDAYGVQNANLEIIVLPEARRMLAELLNESLSHSVVAHHELLQAEAATRLVDLQASLEHLRELEEARGHLLHSTAHDLRGSLSIVQGSSTLLNDEHLSQTQRAQMTQVLHRGVESLQQMLADLMDMARLEAGRERRCIEPFNASQMLTKLCHSCQSLAAERGLSLQAEGPPTLLVEGDSIKVRRIAQNLLLNGLKYTQQGGVQVMWREDGDDRWLLCVQDTGPGLQGSTAAPLAHELEDATQTARESQSGITPALNLASDAPESPINEPSVPKTSTAGEGIGLSVVKRLCELLDATLELDSKAGTGTTIQILFPRRYDC